MSTISRLLDRWRGSEPSPWRARGRRIPVTDLERGMRVTLLGQIYEVTEVTCRFANERCVVLDQIGGPNLLRLDDLEFPFAVFELDEDEAS